MRTEYKDWLQQQKYDPATITAQLHRVGRVEKCYGDLDEQYAQDHMQSVISALKYTADDRRQNKPNPTKIPFQGDAYNNLSSYRNAIVLYQRFKDAIATHSSMVVEPPMVRTPVDVGDDQESGQRFGLERDMQATLRLKIEQLEADLTIVDDGIERCVDSGRIDITAHDGAGAFVVIELKAGTARQAAVGQILSYMGDISIEESPAHVRGILVASDFDNKARAAARMVPNLVLRQYSIEFQFTDCI